MSESDEAVPAADEIPSLSITPDGSIPTGCIMIAAYIDSDGDTAWGYTVKGMSQVTALGYLELLKREVLDT